MNWRKYFKVPLTEEKLEKELKNVSRKMSAESRLYREAIGKLNSNFNKTLKSLNISDYEFKVYSQWGDDGIIQFLVNYLEIDKKIFVEFGVESYVECNTRFLLVNDNWQGFIMDGSEESISRVRNDEIFWKFNLNAKAAFVNAENINNLLEDNSVTGEIGLLHIDVDGNDYWIWKSINVINPVIVIVEYNSLFGSQLPWTIPYNPDFVRSKAHHSNLYYGTSLKALCDLAQSKSYSFIGCNRNGNNAYFVRNDKLKELKPLTSEAGYICSQFSESRDENGQLTYIRGENRIKIISGLEVYNTKTEKIELIPQHK